MARIERDRVSLHYEVHGQPSSAVPLLLSHGFVASSDMWDANVDALSAERQVITWDLRGHGWTVAPADPSAYSQQAAIADMAAILDACGIKRAAVGGLSLGGFLSMAFYVAHPERVAALLLFDTGPGYKNNEARAKWNAFAVRQAEKFETVGLEALAGPEAAMGPHDPTGLALAARGILTQADATVMESLPSIAVPTLIVVGGEDQPYMAATDYMADRIPGAVKVVIAGAGHLANIDGADDFNREVAGFLRDVR